MGPCALAWSSKCWRWGRCVAGASSAATARERGGAMKTPAGKDRGRREQRRESGNRLSRALRFTQAHETGAAHPRDIEEGPPRTEGVVPLPRAAGREGEGAQRLRGCQTASDEVFVLFEEAHGLGQRIAAERVDRKSTRLNSSHLVISYAVFCLKKKKITLNHLAERVVNEC